MSLNGASFKEIRCQHDFCYTGNVSVAIIFVEFPVRYWRAEGEIQKTFPVCPFCGSNKMEGTFKIGIEDEITCKTCGAEWKLLFDPISGKLKWARLVTPSKYGGAELAGKNPQISGFFLANKGILRCSKF